ncbi:hypothetical protein PJL15_00061 [Paenarthrobacter nitroguajacolicus]|nr:hypothetical protein [Paenarthrobacter nitroguajacolicus]
MEVPPPTLSNGVVTSGQVLQGTLQQIEGAYLQRTSEEVKR